MQAMTGTWQEAPLRLVASRRNKWGWGRVGKEHRKNAEKWDVYKIWRLYFPSSGIFFFLISDFFLFLVLWMQFALHSHWDSTQRQLLYLPREQKTVLVFRFFFFWANYNENSGNFWEDCNYAIFKLWNFPWLEALLSSLLIQLIFIQKKRKIDKAVALEVLSSLICSLFFGNFYKYRSSNLHKDVCFHTDIFEILWSFHTSVYIMFEHV